MLKQYDNIIRKINEIKQHCSGSGRDCDMSVNG